MRSIRKLALMGLMALMAVAAFASSAFAVTAVNATNNTALAVNSQVNGHSTNATLTGTFFSVSTSVSCSTSAVVGTVTANPDASGVVRGSVTQLSFTGCINEANGNVCNVVVNGLPWNPTGAGLAATSTSSVSLGTGAGSITISGTGCLPLNNTCSFQGSGSAAGMTNTVTGTFNNTTSVLSFVNAAVKSGTCGNGTWSADYTLRTGSTVGSGDLIKLI